MNQKIWTQPGRGPQPPGSSPWPPCLEDFNTESAERLGELCVESLLFPRDAQSRSEKLNVRVAGRTSWLVELRVSWLLTRADLLHCRNPNKLNSRTLLVRYCIAGVDFQVRVLSSGSESNCGES